MSQTTKKGAVAEAVIAAEATKLGFVVLRPTTEGRRYDLVIDTGPQLLRVQCKWAKRKEGVVVINTSTRRLTPHGYVQTSYGIGEIDGIAAYCQELERCFYLPISVVAGRCVFHLRLVPAANNQELAINWAADHVFWGYSSAGRAFGWQPKGRGFESP